MLNIDAFIDRLEQLMENHQLNAASFSEKIGVQRSSLSHILSRRNKPSLDFILKIQAQFDEVDFDWLLVGTSKKVSFAPDDLKKQETATEKKEDFKEAAFESFSCIKRIAYGKFRRHELFIANFSLQETRNKARNWS